MPFAICRALQSVTVGVSHFFCLGEVLIVSQTFRDPCRCLNRTRKRQCRLPFRLRAEISSLQFDFAAIPSCYLGIDPEQKIGKTPKKDKQGQIRTCPNRENETPLPFETLLQFGYNSSIQPGEGSHQACKKCRETLESRNFVHRAFCKIFLATQAHTTKYRCLELAENT